MTLMGGGVAWPSPGSEPGAGSSLLGNKPPKGLFPAPEELSTRDVAEPSCSLWQHSLCQSRNKSSGGEWCCFSHKMIQFSHLIKGPFLLVWLYFLILHCHYFLATWEWICCLRKRRCGSLWWQPSVSNYVLAESQLQGSDKNHQIYQRNCLIFIWYLSSLAIKVHPHILGIFSFSFFLFMALWLWPHRFHISKYYS